MVFLNKKAFKNSFISSMLTFESNYPEVMKGEKIDPFYIIYRPPNYIREFQVTKIDLSNNSHSQILGNLYNYFIINNKLGFEEYSIMIIYQGSGKLKLAHQEVLKLDLYKLFFI